MQTKKSLAEYVKEHRVVIVVTAIAAAVGAILGAIAFYPVLALDKNGTGQKCKRGSLTDFQRGERLYETLYQTEGVFLG